MAQKKAVDLQFQTSSLIQPILDDPARFKVICCGRRFGKTYVALEDQLNTLLDVSATLRIKTRGLVLAPTYKLVEEDWRCLNALLPNSWYSRNIADLSMEVHSSQGGQCDIQMNSTESEGGVGRGGGFHHVIFDECARIPERIWTEEIRPAISDTMGRAIFISTPKGRNWFYRLWIKAHESPNWSAYQHTTMDGWRARYAEIPHLLKVAEDEWAELESTTAEKTFQEEYLAKFLEHEGQLWSLSKVLRGSLRPALPGRHYIAGLDVARIEDWMVTLIMEVESHQVVGLIRSKHRAWDAQKATAIGLLRQYPNVRILIDSTGVGDPIAQDLRSEGLDVEDVRFTAKVKQELVENLTVAIEQGLIAVPDELNTIWLLEELRSYEETQTKTGHITYSAPEGLHDDGVTALMLACWGLRYELQQPVVDLTTSPADAWSLQDSTNYGRQVDRWRQVNPDLLVPAHPRDLAWKFNQRWGRA